MEITLICAGIALVAAVVSVVVLWIKVHNVKKDFRTLTIIHDNFVDRVNDVYEDLVNQCNEKIDIVNGYLNDIDAVLETNEEILTDIIETVWLGLDADEILMNKINQLEDESDYMWAVMEEHDDAIDECNDVIDTIYTIFEDEPESFVSEFTLDDDDIMVSWCCNKVDEDDDYEYFETTEVTAKRKPKTNTKTKKTSNK